MQLLGAFELETEDLNRKILDFPLLVTDGTYPPLTATKLLKDSLISNYESRKGRR